MRWKQSLFDRFMDKVSPEPNSGCWLWTAACNSDGYGHFKVSGRGRMAHVIARELFIGKVKEGLELDHLCRVRCCVNPYHVEPVTHKENVNRGISSPDAIVNRQKSKTHCPKGHAYDAENTFIYHRRDNYRQRQCRTCHRESEKMRRARAIDFQKGSSE